MSGFKKGLSGLVLSIVLIATIVFAADFADFVYVETDRAGITHVGIRIRLVLDQGPLNPAFEVVDSSLKSLFQILPSGHLQNRAGINTEAAQYGSAFVAHNYDDQLPEHTNGIGSYDHTGGAQETLFTKTSGDDFTQNDADTGAHIVLLGANEGAIAEIKAFIDADNVIVDGCSWTGDLASQSFWVFKHPSFVVCDGWEAEFSVDGVGKFEIFSYDFTGSIMFEIVLDAAGDGIDAQVIEAEANGYNLIVGQRISYIAGDIQPGDVGGGLFITLDEVDSPDSDATTILGALALSTTDVNAATKRAVVVLPGFDSALILIGSAPIDPEYGYEVTSGSVVDRVNSGGAGNDAFINDAVDVEMFDTTGDYILIGSDYIFEILQYIAVTPAFKDVLETVEYSTGAGTWGALALIADTINGYQGSGLYTWDDPGDWVKVTEAEAPADITSAYYLKIAATYIGVMPTLPEESFFKIYANTDTSMEVRGDGSIKPKLSADADMPNDSIYNSSTQGVIVYKDSGGVVHDFY